MSAAICMSSWKKCLFRFSADFLTALFVCLVLSCMSSLHILDIKPFVDLFPYPRVCFFFIDLRERDERERETREREREREKHQCEREILTGYFPHGPQTRD